MTEWNTGKKAGGFRWLLIAAGVLALVARMSAAEGDKASIFGSRTQSDAGLIGIIYDLKQTQKRTPIDEKYTDIVKEFLENNWDESVLNRYFRAVQPIYATQVFIPLMPADAAPAAFGVEKIIRPSRWVIHYKGQVSPPEDGTYRFLCYADDLILAAVDGKVVCQGSMDDSWIESVSPLQAAKGGPGIGNGQLRIGGDWVDMKKDVPVDLDVLIGERPGGSFCAFLLYEKKGEVYPQKDGRTIYPAFQLAPGTTPDYPSDLLKDIKYWKGYP